MKDFVFCPLQVILKADKTSNNFSDRAILKNLGRWLGLQTLARNKPILQDVRMCNKSTWISEVVGYVYIHRLNCMIDVTM